MPKITEDDHQGWVSNANAGKQPNDARNGCTPTTGDLADRLDAAVVVP
jgi:hypothetical protein